MTLPVTVGDRVNTWLGPWIKAVARPDRVVRYARGRLLARFAWKSYLQRLRPPVHDGPACLTEADVDAIARDLAANDVRVEPLALAGADFAGFVRRARLDRFPGFYSGGMPRVRQKAHEYFIAARLLDLEPGQVYIDVASQDSPAPRVYEEMHGVRAFRQDLVYPSGMHGHRIGGSAGSMVVSDAFADAMALHNAFEHFEGDADVRFVREAARVLRPGGRLCIVPLFMHTEYAVQTDPTVSVGLGIPFEDDAVLYAAPSWNDRHGRCYDVPHFLARIVANLGPMRLTVYRLTNAVEMGPEYYTRFVALFEKP